MTDHHDDNGDTADEPGPEDTTPERDQQDAGLDGGAAAAAEDERVGPGDAPDEDD